MRALFLIGLCAACTEHVPPPPIVPTEDPSEEWADLIGRASSDTGVDYAVILGERATLDWYLGWVAVHGPATDEMKEVWEDLRLAFLINAYNAQIVQGVIRGPNPRGPLDDHFWRGTAYRVDKDWIAPRRFADERLIARFAEPLLYLALYQGSRGGPPLRWFRDDHLTEDLRDAAIAFLASDRGMRPNENGWAASALLVDHAEDFEDWGEAVTLCDWMARYTTGPRQAWLLLHKADCPLGSFPVDPSPDGDLPQPAR